MNRIDRNIREAGEAVDATMSRIAMVDKLRELYDYFVHEADRAAGKDKEREMLRRAAEITEVLELGGAL
jgi:hypothetical protein